MKTWDFDAVVYNGNVYCNECCPVDLDAPAVHPIFASEEWASIPVCDVCGTEHDYVTLLCVTLVVIRNGDIVEELHTDIPVGTRDMYEAVSAYLEEAGYSFLPCPAGSLQYITDNYRLLVFVQ